MQAFNRFCLAATVAGAMLVGACGETAVPSVDGGPDGTGTADQLTGNDGGGDVVFTECTALSEGECGGRDDCQLVDSCPACDGADPAPRCLPEGAAVEPCAPLTCQAGGCRSGDDCSGASGGPLCVGPGESLGCGACNNSPATCASDADCASAGNAICVPVPCSCDGQGTQCVPGCESDDDCAPESQCDGSGHCEARSCVDASGCPAQFDCNGGACQRRSCTADGDCASGYCVNGSCQDELGQCGAPPP
jgi:hypothetical protein